MTKHTTHIAHDQEIAAITFAPSDPGYPWYPVHAWLHRSGLYPLLPPGARGVIDVLLWRDWEQQQGRDGTPGLVVATIDQIAAWCGDSSRTTFRAVGFLLEPTPEIVAITGNPARLLAKRGPTVWEPMPGRGLIRRKGRTDPPPNDTGLPRLAKSCRNSCAPSSERARAPYQTKESEIKTKTESGAQGAASSGLIYSRGFGMGWPEWTLFGHRAIAAGDVRGVLADMKLGGPLLDATANLPGLSVAEIVSVAGDVATDPGIVNPLRRPVAVAWRLHKARGMAMPQANKGGKGKGVGAILGAPVKSAESVRVAVDALSVAAGLDAIRKRRNLGG